MNRWVKALARGAWAGGRATVPMSVVMKSAQAVGMLGEMPPRKLTKSFLGAIGASGQASESETDAAAVAAHFGFGAGLGAVFGLLREAGLLPRSVWSGIAYGTAVWAANYAGWIPALAIMPSPQNDRPGRPTSMVLAHWVYGISLERRLR